TTMHPRWRSRTSSHRIAWFIVISSCLVRSTTAAVPGSMGTGMLLSMLPPMLLSFVRRGRHVAGPAELGAGHECGWGWWLAALVVALVRGFAARESRTDREPATGPGVVELQVLPVFVLRYEFVVGREEHVVPVGAHRLEASGGRFRQVQEVIQVR